MLCEDVRHEQGGLLTLIGFYGVLPHVEIRVRDFTLPLARLAFVLMAEGTVEGKGHRTNFQVIGPNGEMVVPGRESVEGSPMSGSVRMRMSAAVTSPLLPGPGVYRVVYKVDDEDHFTSTFTVKPDTGRSKNF